MNNPAFIVDGFTEKLIIQRICPGKPIRRTDLNGKYASIKAIAKKISSLIRLLGNRHYPIIILIDKEAREASCADIIKELRIEIEIEDIDIRIGVADRMIENWILADWPSLTGNNNKPEDTDGSNGSAEIRKLKGTYNKTTDGVEFFAQANPSIMYTNSNSFKHFIDCLEGVDCEYIKFEK